MAPPHLPHSLDRHQAGLTHPYPFGKGRGDCSILASEGAEAVLMGGACRWVTCEVGGVESEGRVRVVVVEEGENEQTSTASQLMSVSNSDISHR